MTPTRIYYIGNLIYFQVDATGFFKAYPREKTILSFSNGRYYFEFDKKIVHSSLFSEILDRNGNPFTSQETFELSIASEDAVSGYAIHRVVSAASTNATLIKSGPTKFVGGIYTNDTAGELYVKYYNKATAPTIGTDIPVLTFSIPANDSKVIELDNPIDFPLGLGLGMTGLAIDNDTTAIVAIADVIAQTFIEGLEKTDVIGLIETNSVTIGILTADGTLVGVINNSSTNLSVIIAEGVLVATAVATASSTVGVLEAMGTLSSSVNSFTDTVSILIDKP